ncbi:MAG TPA: amino acid permease [Planctomycetaceae bacterium]
MFWRQALRRKPFDRLLAEAEEDRLHRALGPVSLTSLGVGAIIGAGIFAMTGQVAADDAGPAVVLSFVVAGIACALAALCYAEFAAMAPVAGSAYTYTYATLGEMLAWVIGWDLILEYAMSCSVVAAAWTHYLDELLQIGFGVGLPVEWTVDPFTGAKEGSRVVQTYCNLPAVLIILAVTAVLVKGIRESAFTNALLVVVKVAVVLFVIALGVGYVKSENWTSVPPESRKPTVLADYLARHPEVAAKVPAEAVTPATSGEGFVERYPEAVAGLTPAERAEVAALPSEVRKWGLLGVTGVNRWLAPVDEAVRGPFFPYGLSGVMVGAAIVFFAYIGFDSISTHAEEAVRPQRDVPFGILASLGLCTLLYILVSGVITGMEPYPQIDRDAAVAAAFRKQAEATGSVLLRGSAGLIALGALAGMTSVLLVTFLSQARIFLAMARDGLLPRGVFSALHPRFRTPHRATILTGLLVALTAGFTPIETLAEMVNIGTLMAFAFVCAAVLVLRIIRPEVRRPFRCPAVYLVAPLGIIVSVTMALFLPLDTWARLAAWLAAGLTIYFAYGMRHSTLREPSDIEPGSGPGE